MTVKLFCKDPYKKTHETKIKFIERIDDKKVKIAFNETIIYSFSGGQESDSAKVIHDNAKYDIIDSYIDKKTKDIFYIINLGENEKNIKINDKVILEIDIEKRKKIMKLHSAMHIVHILFEKKTGISTLIGSNLANEKGRLDYECKKNINEFLEEIENQTNDFLNKKIDIKIEEKNNINYWICENYSFPCGGTHVKNTKEIKKIKLKRKNIGKNKERIEVTLA